MIFKIGQAKCNLNLDLGSGCTIINHTSATNFMQNCEHAKWSTKAFELKSFLNDTVETLSTLKSTVHFND